MVNSFVLDFMHLGYLSVMKKILTEYWIKSTKKMCTRQNVLQISQRLTNLSKAVPIEFLRTTRSLGETGKWKATEYRFFLLYAGMFIMKGILSEDLYKHFLLLVMACRILCCKKSCQQYADHAEVYLKHFVLLSMKLYGNETLVLIRSGNKPLEQLCRRLQQEELYTKPKVMRLGLCQIHKKKTLKDKVKIKSIQFRNCQVTTKTPNNYVLLKNGTIVEVFQIYSNEETEDLKKNHHQRKINRNY
ncbi:uncharacterized protein LOC107980939 isoform X1 [Nasonia vitripennis]|uniref:Uncharacterized protein n=1 Tax=Nasonia vitripennis TaxID=7425 RepID=A0A7M7ISU6_NASVI|nr:uncharacterized protein LOC107980939 isoform X1 [Nasonia vitripennis]